MTELDEFKRVQIERDELLKNAKNISRPFDNKIENLLRSFFEAFNKQSEDEFSLRMSRIAKDARHSSSVGDAFADLMEENHIDNNIPWYWEEIKEWKIINNDLYITYLGAYPHDETQEYEMIFDLSATTVDQLITKFENAAKKWKLFMSDYEAKLLEKTKKTTKETVKDLKKKIKSLEQKVEEIENNNRGNY